jgi:hypothetical protein
MPSSHAPIIECILPADDRRRSGQAGEDLIITQDMNASIGAELRRLGACFEHGFIPIALHDSRSVGVRLIC